MNKQSRRKPGAVVQREPRWPVILTLVAIAGLYLSLPEWLTPGPTWAVPGLLAALMIPAVLSHKWGYVKLNHGLGVAVCAMLTAADVWCLATLVSGLPGKREAPTELLRSAVALWISNILVFACWYWRLDAGGPHQRALNRKHEQGAFLFPQMMLPDPEGINDFWKPGFVDYLFLAFNTSTAFSPTDVPVLSRWAKVLMMIQSVISLGTIAILAARAINIL
jgi:hypothetical protein